MPHLRLRLSAACGRPFLANTCNLKPAILFAFILLVAAMSIPASAQQKVIPESTPRAVQNGNAQFAGHYDPQQMLRLVFALQPPHMQQEEEFIRQLQDPDSPQFHQFLTEAQWDERFAPSIQDEQAVVAWAQTQGLTITSRYSNRLLVDVEAPVAAIEKALNVSINSYQIGPSSHFSNDRDPSIPAALGNVIRSVHGLNNIDVVHTHTTNKTKVSYPVYSPGPVEALGSNLTGDGDRNSLA